MKRTTLLITGLIVALLVIFLITGYNGFVKRQEVVKKQWSEVQNTYQRRLDLIPSLVATVKGVSEFERGTLVEVTEARNRAGSISVTDNVNAETYNQQSRLQDSLAAAANRLIVVIEQYPVLKGTAAYSGLQTQLEGTERRIKIARDDFNAAVADYNKSVRSFPRNLVAGIFGFEGYEGFQAEAGAERAVEIKFD